MPTIPSISFSSQQLPSTGRIVLLCDASNTFSPQGDKLNANGLLRRAIKASRFKGGFGKKLDLLVPEGTGLERITLLGVGKTKDLDEHSWIRLGGKMVAALDGAKQASIAVSLGGDTKVSHQDAANMALGVKLGAYRFTRYKTDKSSQQRRKLALKFHVDNAATADRTWKEVSGVGDGVLFARDLVNEPANVLTPIEFAQRAKGLEKLGCKVALLDEKQMGKLKMNALLGVSRGSRNAPRMAIIEWNGGRKGERPVAFVGKGVTFDTGGISIKPAGGMEDMKGDMGGAAAVAGLMHALSARKAKVNAVGIIALVENMPDGDAQRPGDIVTSMSGQTIEVLNTDAEGRLILADALWHCREKFDPKFMINLATLTGAILVALGNHHAGLFSNNDKLSERLAEAGQNTREKVWRLPLGSEYDKMIDSKNADMKNIGGRYAGSITAGQFLQRFVKKTPWAHLDIAGTAMGSPKNEINQSWGSGFGVRLLDRLVANNYEK